MDKQYDTAMKEKYRYISDILLPNEPSYEYEIIRTMDRGYVNLATDPITIHMPLSNTDEQNEAEMFLRLGHIAYTVHYTPLIKNPVQRIIFKTLNTFCLLRSIAFRHPELKYLIDKHEKYIFNLEDSNAYTEIIKDIYFGNLNEETLTDEQLEFAKVVASFKLTEAESFTMWAYRTVMKANIQIY